MTIVSQTSRLILSEFSAGDASSFYELNLDSEVIKYTGDKAFESVEQAMEFLSQYTHYAKYGYGRWAIRDKEGNYLGWCGLKFSPELNEIHADDEP